LAGEGLQLLVEATDSQFRPLAHDVLQPPQWSSLVEMLTQRPPQQRLEELPPHEAPLLRLGCVQAPFPLQTSMVQAFPSSAQARPLWIVSLHVAVPLQLRVMHALLLQVIRVPRQVVLEHVSPCVQASPSLQLLALAVSWQVPETHVSVVHGFPSLQSAATLHPVHAPAEQTPSAPLASRHASPSGKLVRTHPVAESHESAVHGFPSLHSSAVPGSQLAPVHVSFTVHASPSSQPEPFSTCTHPRVGSQESSVHGF
jgi:hypothetical protein